MSFCLTLFNSLSYASVPLPKIVAAQNQDQADTSFSIPGEFGKIEESFPGSNGKTIIYIQDAHDSLQAQENIAKMIHHLVDQYGVKTVYEEGYEGPVPTDDLFGFIQDPTVKEKVSYFLMDKLRIGGAEYAHINRFYTPHPFPSPPEGERVGVRGDFKLIGADNIKLQLENISWYRQTAMHKQETQRDLEAIQSEITRLANQSFSKEFKEWLKLKDRLDGNLLNLPDYLKRTADLILSKMPRDQFQSHYPNIGLLLSADNPQNPELITKIKAIDYKILFGEIDQIENNLADLELSSQEDRKTYRLHKELALLKRLSDIELNPAEYDAVKGTLNGLKTQEFADFIAHATSKSIVLSKHWENTIESAIKFYEVAQARDKSLERRLDEFIGNGSEQIAVLVFGGFHKEELKEIFRTKNISYQIVTPTITSLDGKHHEYYKNLMRITSYPFEIPMNLARASRNLTTFGRARIVGVRAVRSELRAMSLIVARGGNLETPELRRMVLFEFQNDQASEQKRSEMRAKKLKQEEVAIDSDGWTKLSDLVAVLATGQTDIQQAVSQAITAGNKLDPIIGKVEAPRDYWSGVVDDFITAQFPDPDRPMVELVTNAVDAVNRGDFPKEVRVTFQKGSMSVEDQGSGMGLNDILRKLLIPTISGSMGRENLIGRFGVGFYSVLSYLKNPTDQLTLETSDGKTAHKISFRVSPIAEIEIKVETIPPRARGTKVIVQSETLLPERAEAWIREVLQFHSSKRAKIIVNGKIINATENLNIVGSRQGVSVWTSKERAEGQGRAVVTVNGVAIFSMPVHGYQVPKVTVLDFPQTTPLPVTRNTIDVTPATVESTKIGIDLISEITPMQESLLLSALYPIVEAIQQRNPSRLPEDDVLQYLKIRVRERLNQSMKYLPDDEAGQAVKEGYYGYLHPALLDEQALRGWKKDRLPGVETDKPIFITDFGSRYADQVAVVSQRAVFWNRRFVPRSPLQLSLVKLHLNLHGVRVSDEVSIKKKTTARKAVSVSHAEPQPIQQVKIGAEASKTEMGNRLKKLIAINNLRTLIKKATSDSLEDDFADILVTADELQQFISEIPEATLKEILNVTESWSDVVMAGNILNRFISARRKLAHTRYMLPSWNVWTSQSVREALEIGRRSMKEFDWDIRDGIIWRDLLHAIIIMPLVVSSQDNLVHQWMEVELERLFSSEGKKDGRWATGSSSWSAFVLQELLRSPGGHRLIVDNELWNWFFQQWKSLPRNKFDQATGGFGAIIKAGIPDLLGEALPQVLQALRTRNITSEQFYHFNAIAGELIMLLPKGVNVSVVGERYKALWLDETNGLLTHSPEAYERIIQQLINMAKYVGGGGYQLRIGRDARPYANFLLGARERAAAQNISTASQQTYDAKINLSKLVGLFLQGKRLKGSAGQLLTSLGQASKASLPSETQELAQRTIQHAANFQSTVPHVFLRELIQNAADEAVASDAKPTDRVVEVNVAEANPGQLMLDFQDRFGMDLEKILNFLLIPGASTKKGDVAQIGEFGQGFFTIFKEAEGVYIKTKIPRGQTVYLKLTPIRNGQGQISDVEVKIAVRKEKGSRGTTIQWIKNSRNVEMEAAFLKAFATTYAGLVSPDLLTVRWGESTLNESKRLLAERESPHGTLRLYAAPGENTVTHRGLYVKEFDEKEFWSGVPEVARKVLLKHGIVLELPAQIRLIKDRTDLANKPAVLGALRPMLTSMALDGVIKLFATGEIALDLIPYDYLTDFTRYKIPDDIQTDAKTVVQGQPINVTSYSDQTRLAQLLVSMPIFEVSGREQKLTFQEVLEGLRSGALQREDLPEAVSKHLFGQWLVHAFQEAIIKSERQKARKPMKMEDRRLRDPSIQEAQALWAFRDLSEGISHLVTQIDGKPRQIVQTFYQHTGRDLAHAVQGGGAVGWNLSWWGGKLPQLGDILQGKEPLDSPLAQEWFVNYLETLTHEMVHITEGSDDWTHHADFSAKQRKFVEGLIRSSSKIEEAWRRVTQQYPKGTLPEGALDVYVLKHSKFVEIEKNPPAQTVSAGGRSELRLAPINILPSQVQIRTSVENLQGRFTVFVDLADIAALTDEQFTEDYEKTALRHKNVSFVFYNAETEIDSGKRERLAKLQEQLGLQRVEITNAPLTGLLARQWFGKLIHVSKGKPAVDLNLIQATALRRDIYLFRYIENEIGVVPTALLVANQDIKSFEGQVIDLSMVSERLRSEVLQYLASLVIARAA